MRLLSWIVVLGIFPVVLGAWQMLLRMRVLHLDASKNKAFQMRRGSLSPTQWRNWNREFLVMRILRIPFLIAVFEGVLFGLVLKQPQHIFGLCFFLVLSQMFPVGVVYLLHLWLLFRYGGYNLERFDPRQETSQRVAFFFFVLCSWGPLAGTWVYFRFLFPGGG